MEKPKTLSVKDWIIRKMSISMMIQERVIQAVIDHEFSSARNAIRTCNSIEFSGFGKYCFNIKKAKYKLNKHLVTKQWYEKMLNEDDYSINSKHTLEIKLYSVTNDIELLKSKINEIKPGIRRMEESPVPSFPSEGDNTMGG